MRLLLWGSTALWRRGVIERVALAVSGFLQRGEFSREQPVWFLLQQYLTGILRKILFLEEIQG
jgi:hypothetical protein